MGGSGGSGGSGGDQGGSSGGGCSDHIWKAIRFHAVGQVAISSPVSGRPPIPLSGAEVTIQAASWGDDHQSPVATGTSNPKFDIADTATAPGCAPSTYVFATATIERGGRQLSSQTAVKSLPLSWPADGRLPVVDFGTILIVDTGMK